MAWLPICTLSFNPPISPANYGFDPTPELRNKPVPADKTDAYSVLLHTPASNGKRDGTTGTLPGSPPYESTFDKWGIYTCVRIDLPTTSAQ